jgi:hypothetical protein
MSHAAKDPQPPYHLHLDPGEVPVAASALRLLISDEAHQPEIRRLARAVLADLGAAADERGNLTLTLEPEQMKIIHTAVQLLFEDLRRGQASERETLRGILNKLPDTHTMRAIKLE